MHWVPLAESNSGQKISGKWNLWSNRPSGQRNPLVKNPLVKKPLVNGTLVKKTLVKSTLWSTGLWSKDPRQTNVSISRILSPKINQENQKMRCSEVHLMQWGAWGAWGAHTNRHTQTHWHTDTRTHGQEHVLENRPEKWFFSLFSNYMFFESWKLVL